LVVSQGYFAKVSGFEVFAKIFSKNIMIPSREIPLCWQGYPTVLGDYHQIWFLQFSSDDPNHQIWLFGSPE
jgi:hypothetical protein